MSDKPKDEPKTGRKDAEKPPPVVVGMKPAEAVGRRGKANAETGGR